MSTAKIITNTPRQSDHFPMPDPPERTPDEMSSFNHLTLTGGAYLLAKHLGNPETTLVAGEHFVASNRTRNLAGLRYPDLLIAFDVDPEAYYRSNAYILSEQGKSPDFVLEIASRSTGHMDVGVKRDNYAALGITEYWRFDQTGQYHGTRLAGDLLVGGQYEPITIEEPEDGVLQGYSAALNLILRWESGQLGWHDPATGSHIATLDDERAARFQAEARVRELEEELRRLREG